MISSLPDDLPALESTLGSLDAVQPPPELRRRVLGAVHNELSGHSSTRQDSAWDFAAGLAAALLLCANLAMSGALSTPLPQRTTSLVDPAEVDRLARELRRALPQMSEEEARHHAQNLLQQPQMVLRPVIE